jgi:hypothetical protein
MLTRKEHSKMKKNFYHGIILSLLALTILSGCGGGKSGGNNPPDVSGDPSAITHVYVAGTVYSTVSKAVYWEDEDFKTLDDGSAPSMANSITFSGGAVYVAGQAGQTAVYWKDGNRIPLKQSSGTNDSVAASIAVAGGDVHVAGVQYNSSRTSIATYWKNNSDPVELAADTNNSVATSIAVAGGAVYAVGFENDRAMYWKIDASGYVVLAQPLGNGSSANSVTVSGGTVYVAGKQSDKATYWKIDAGSNTIVDTVTLDTGTIYSEATSIVVSGSDVYVVGYRFGTNSVAMRWKNEGTAKSLSDDSTNAMAYSVAVSGGDVYVVGVQYNSSGEPVATYWKNDEAPVSLNGGTNTSAMSIFIDRH